MDRTAAWKLSDYRLPVVVLDCARCHRHTEPHVVLLRKKFGDDLTLGDVAIRVAAAGGCALASLGSCGVRPLEPPVERWATLDDAKAGGWAAILHCARHLAALKRAKPCREPIELHVITLIGALGHSQTLDKQPHLLRCPRCGAKSVSVEWVGPTEPTAPGGSALAEPVRLLPIRAALGRQRFRVIE